MEPYIAPDKPWHLTYASMGVTGVLPYPDISMSALLAQTAGEHPDLPAIDFMGTGISYRFLLKQIGLAAGALTKMGIRRGDVVAICLPNIPQCVVAFYAINRIGAVACMIHPLSSPAEVEAFIRDSGSKALFALDLLYPSLAPVASSTGIHRTVVCSVNEFMNPLLSAAYAFKMRKKYRPIVWDERTVRWRDFLREAAPLSSPDEGKGDDVAAILYSGGTSSGTPKGILLTNLNFNALALNIREYEKRIRPGKSILTILPLFHGFGLGICVHTVMVSGVKAILVPQFSTTLFVNTIRKKKPNFIAGVPSMYQALIGSPKAANIDFGFLEGAFSGGDTTKREVKLRFNEFMKAHGGTVTLREGYGLTEIVTACTIHPGGDEKIDSVGVPLPGVDLKIVKHGTEEAVPYGENGEICLRGESVMKGYLNSPEETAAALRRHDDGNTWLHTGDMGTMDEEGYLFFQQRIKRIIKCSGFTVYPSCVEDVVMSLPGVSDCVVIGVPDAYHGQHVKAFVLMEDPSQAGDPARKLILDRCAAELNKWSIPKEIEFREVLPQTRVGKVDVVALEREESGSVS